MEPSTRAHSISCNTPSQTASFRMRDSKGKPKTMTVSWPGPLGHASAIRTRGSEEHAVEYSLASTTTEIAPSRCLDVSRQTTVQIHQQTVSMQCALRPAVHGSYTSTGKSITTLNREVMTPQAAHHAAPQALTEAAIGRQRTATDTHSFASELLFRRRVALLALHQADHG